MGGAVFPPCWLFFLRQPSTGDYKLFGRANGGLQEGSCPWVLPRTSAVTVLSLSAGDLLTLAYRSCSVSYGSTAPSPWVLVHTLLCVCPPRACSLCFPQSCWSPAIKFHWPSKSNSLGIPPPLLDPQVWKPDVGLRTFTPVSGLLWYNCPPVCESPTQQLWDLILSWLRLSPVAPPTLLHCSFSFVLVVRYLFWWVPVSFCQWLFSSLDVILVLSQEEVSSCPSTPPFWTNLQSQSTFIHKLTFSLLKP